MEENKKLSAKTFAFLVYSSFISALLFLMFCIFCANKYWARYENQNINEGIIDIKSNQNSFQGKISYITQKNLPYNAFVFGGSKAGGLSAKELSDKTGLCFYNFWQSSFCFSDYELLLDYLLKNYDGEIKEIILHLSSHTVERIQSQYKDIMPYEILKMIYNPFVAKVKVIKQVFRKYTNINEFYSLYTTRNQIIEDRYLTLSDGSRSFRDQEAEWQKDKDVYAKKYVYDGWGKFDDCLKSLFTNTSDGTVIACAHNIETLKRIKQKCDDRGIKLTVMIGPTFFSELYKYASSKYVQYLKDVVSVCEVWNFSGINEVDMNPYNFCDAGHYFDFIGDRMINTVYAKSIPNTTDMDAFGILLTAENIDLYTESQMEKWQELKKEYENFGTISLVFS